MRATHPGSSHRSDLATAECSRGREVFCVHCFRGQNRLFFVNMSLAEIKTAVDQLSPRELAELEAFIRDRDNAAWDRQIDEVRHDARAGCVQELP